MIGAALSRRGGKLTLGLRLGRPVATLANTLGTSTLLPAQVNGALPILTDIDTRLTALGA